MPTTPDQCVNYAINLQMCPCTAEDCERRGICCECLQAHHSRDSRTSCMKGAERNPDTLSLLQSAVAKCAVNHPRNLEFCVCTYEPCERKGVCCNCVRNHFAVDGTGRVACMKGF